MSAVAGGPADADPDRPGGKGATLWVGVGVAACQRTERSREETEVLLVAAIRC